MELRLVRGDTCGSYAPSFQTIGIFVRFLQSGRYYPRMKSISNRANDPAIAFALSISNFSQYFVAWSPDYIGGLDVIAMGIAASARSGTRSPDDRRMAALR